MKLFNSYLYLITFLLNGARKLFAEPCPENDWSSYGGYCYYVSTTVATWRDATHACHMTGAQLVSIETQTEQHFINTTLADLPDAEPYVWTGLNEQDDGTWRWPDDTNTTYENWAEGEGDDITEQCMAMSHISGVAGLWYDHHCESKFLWMCKKHPESNSTISTPAPTPAQGYCRHAYFQYRDKCYKIGASSQVTWDEALNLCSSLHPQNMVNIEDEKEQAFLSSLLFNRNTPVWIGARQYHEGEFWWSDNSPLSYTNWYPGQPDGTTGTQSCAYMHADPHNVGFWEDDICTQNFEYMCMTYVDPSNTEPPPPDPHTCKEGYSSWNNNCYKILEYTQSVSWHTADGDCASDGGQLSSISSRYEQAFIFSSLPTEDTCVWVGLSSDYQFGSLTFLWSDGRPTVYTQWAEGEPSMAAEPSCVCLDAQHGDWYTKPCGNAAITRAVCKISEEITETVPAPHALRCSSNDWVLFEGFCYLVNKTKVNQAEAKNRCLQHSGGNLVSVHNTIENQALTIQVQAYGSFWIGLEKDTKGGYHWSDGSELEFFNWDEDEPSNTTDMEECVALDSYGKWFGTTCEVPLGYICKSKSDAEPEEYSSSLGYGWQLLIIMVAVLVLAILIAYVTKQHNRRTETGQATVPSPSTSRNEQLGAHPYSPDDPEHTGYDQPTGIQLPSLSDISLQTTDV